MENINCSVCLFELCSSWVQFVTAPQRSRKSAFVYVHVAVGSTVVSICSCHLFFWIFNFKTVFDWIVPICWQNSCNLCVFFLLFTIDFVNTKHTHTWLVAQWFAFFSCLCFNLPIPCHWRGNTTYMWWCVVLSQVANSKVGWCFFVVISIFQNNGHIKWEMSAQSKGCHHIRFSTHNSWYKDGMWKKNANGASEKERSINLAAMVGWMG